MVPKGSPMCHHREIPGPSIRVVFLKGFDTAAGCIKRARIPTFSERPVNFAAPFGQDYRARRDMVYVRKLRLVLQGLVFLLGVSFTKKTSKETSFKNQF